MSALKAEIAEFSKVFCKTTRRILLTSTGTVSLKQWSLEYAYSKLKSLAELASKRQKRNWRSLSLTNSIFQATWLKSKELRQQRKTTFWKTGVLSPWLSKNLANFRGCSQKSSIVTVLNTLRSRLKNWSFKAQKNSITLWTAKKS